jgi:hypothetical protein
MIKKLSEREKEIANILSHGTKYKILISKDIDLNNISVSNNLNSLGVWKYMNVSKKEGVLTSVYNEKELKNKLEFIFGKNMVSIKKCIESPFQGLPI